jgi:hypothetical protein
MNEPHVNNLLASCSVCTVERCTECDVIHLHFGAASVRLKPAAFVMLCETLLSALAQVAPKAVAFVSSDARGGNAGRH